MRDVTDETFGREVLQAERPVVVDFWAPWCGPCHAITPVLERLESEHGDRISFTRLNVDQNPIAASRHQVMSLPTVIVFAGGEPRATVLGARGRSHYEQALREVLPASELGRNPVAE